MPIAFPKAGKEIVEKIVEVVKEVVRVVSLSPAASIGMEIGVYPHPQVPEAPIEFPTGTRLIVYALRSLLTTLDHSIISNPALPEAQTIISTAYISYMRAINMSPKPSFSMNVITDQSITVSPEQVYSSNPSIGVRKSP